jgi:hypothetical protein
MRSSCDADDQVTDVNYANIMKCIQKMRRFMINVLIPLSGGSKFFDSEEYFYPKMLVEIMGKPMIQLIENFRQCTRLTVHFCR